MAIENTEVDTGSGVLLKQKPKPYDTGFKIRTGANKNAWEGNLQLLDKTRKWVWILLDAGKKETSVK